MCVLYINNNTFAQVTCQLGSRSSAYSISCSLFSFTISLFISHRFWLEPILLPPDISNHHILHVLATFTYDSIGTQLRYQRKTPESGRDNDQKGTLEIFLDRSTL